jgi:hypothetical protein
MVPCQPPASQARSDKDPWLCAGKRKQPKVSITSETFKQNLIMHLLSQGSMLVAAASL